MGETRAGDDGYMVQLDALRALAVAGVVLNHTLPEAFARRVDLGGPGVYLFFVLSGFLITGIILRVKDKVAARRLTLGRAFGTFYIRRFLRIFPLYYFVLFAGCLIGIAEIRAGLPWHTSYLSNVYFAVRGRWQGCTSHLWSLSVEEQFYLFWPALILLLPRSWLLYAFVGAVAAAPCFRLVTFCLTHNSIAAGVLTPSCLDTLGAGALLALLWHTGLIDRAARFRRWSVAAGVAGIVAMVLLNYFDLPVFRARSSVGAVPYAVVFFWLVDAAASGFGGAVGRVLESRPLAYLGKISYGLYVYHLFVPEIVKHVGAALGVALPFPDQRGAGMMVAVSFCTVALASLSWWLFEKRLNDLKRFFPYQARRALGPAPVPVQV